MRNVRLAFLRTQERVHVLTISAASLSIARDKSAQSVKRVRVVLAPILVASVPMANL